MSDLACRFRAPGRFGRFGMISEAYPGFARLKSGVSHGLGPVSQTGGNRAAAAL
jgi:hypothetical protein